MKFSVLFSLVLVWACQGDSGQGWESAASVPIPVTQQDWAIAIHGGAGYMNPDNMSDERIASYEAALQKTLDLGIELLERGTDAVEVVQSVIMLMEDDSLFNAGKGAVLTAKGEAELDASIMRGQDLNCGAVTGIKNIRNPITAARLVMDSSKHVFLSGEGATSYALEHGLVWVENDYFITKARKESYLRLLEERNKLKEEELPTKKGTVGCVVLDRQGHLAAGTSTGGMMMKEHGRIGDSPIIGAGTYADDATCAVSCTGHGEFFIRKAVAYDISARMKYQDTPLHEACEELILGELKDMGGDGGLISLDHFGNISMVFNTTGMFRASADASGTRFVGIFK
jgi:beta-aspartyl-peptidase (threonine type)